MNYYSKNIVIVIRQYLILVVIFGNCPNLADQLRTGLPLRDTWCHLWINNNCHILLYFQHSFMLHLQLLLFLLNCAGHSVHSG